MISKNQALLILSHAEPLVLNAVLPQSPNHICLSPETLYRLGIKESDLLDHAGGLYKGTDYLYGKSKVHVFERDNLERLSGMKWSDYENARRDAMTLMERGG